mgnify:CR=1 FL=1
MCGRYYIDSDMADEIEIINIVHVLVVLQCCKINTTVFKHFSNI